MKQTKRSGSCAIIEKVRENDVNEEKNMWYSSRTKIKSRKGLSKVGRLCMKGSLGIQIRNVEEVD